MWNNITGQTRVKNILKNIYRSQRIPHSFIFYGNDGVGKDAMAIEFAKLVNCDNPSLETGACEQCTSCRRIKNMQTADFKFITALPAAKAASAEEKDDDDDPEFAKGTAEVIRTELLKKMQDNYYKVSIPKATSISIDSIRQLRKEIYLTGEKGKYKTVIISNADAMNVHAANAFLKVLEDPPGNVIMILTTCRLNSLLPTIIGRCQPVRFDNIKDEDLMDFLNKNYKSLSEHEKYFLVKISNGSLNNLKNIIENDLLKMRDKVIDLLRAVVMSSNMEISNIIASVTREKNRELIKQFLMMMVIWFRDISIKKTNNDSLVINRDVLENISRFIQRFDSDDFTIINLLMRFIDDVDRNINIDLLMYNMIYTIKPYLRSL